MTLSRLEHLLVLTDDIDGTRDFWCGALGLVAGERPPLPFSGHWLYLGDTAAVHVADRAEYEATLGRMGLAPATGPVDHVAFAAGDYDALVARLAAAGIEAVPNEIPGAGIRQLFLDDPNGLRIELNVREEGG